MLIQEVVRFVPKREASSWVRVRIYARRIAVHIEANVTILREPLEATPKVSEAYVDALLPQNVYLFDFAVRQVLVGMAPMTRRFVAAMERFALKEGVDLITFERGERKDETAPSAI